MTIQYDGSNFFGWQLQSKDRTIQGVLEKALSNLSGEKRVVVNGAGRTDAGVHALGQVAHFDLDTRLDLPTLKNAINGHLPNDCRLMNIENVAPDFHSRFSATKRYYKYQCIEENLLVFRNQSWLIEKLDLDSLNGCASNFIGEHDFLSFSKFNEDLDHTKCIVNKAEWSRENGFLLFRISANRFLHHMVRYIVGCTVQCARGKMNVKKIKELLDSPQKDVQIFKAPAQGLFLDHVDYS